MKKTIVLILTLVLALSSLPISVSAADLSGKTTPKKTYTFSSIDSSAASSNHNRVKLTLSKDKNMLLSVNYQCEISAYQYRIGLSPLGKGGFITLGYVKPKKLSKNAGNKFTFKVTLNNGKILVTDPYDDTVGYPPLRVKADLVLSSHGHFDHNYFAAVEGTFSAILTNPPIRAGKQTIYQMFADARAHLEPGGCLYVVIRKQQGAPSAIKFLEGIYRNVEIIERGGGYWVLRAEKE